MSMTAIFSSNHLTQSNPIVDMDTAEQMDFRFIAEAKVPKYAPDFVVEKLPDIRAALRYSVQHSHMDQDDIARALDIDPAEFSRMLSSKPSNRKRYFPMEKLSRFYWVTDSYAPMQYLAHEAGLELRALRMESLEQQVERLRQENHYLKQGVAA